MGANHLSSLKILIWLRIFLREISKVIKARNFYQPQSLSITRDINGLSYQIVVPGRLQGILNIMLNSLEKQPRAEYSIFWQTPSVILDFPRDP